MGRLRPGADPARLDEGLQELRGLTIEGLVALRCGRDAGLRAGTWDYAITADLADVAAYRRYDEDPEHDRIRRDLLVPVTEEMVRVQFVVD